MFYFRQLINALCYMHKKKLLCHRDLKPENFLIDTNFDIQLADFGFCSEILIVNQLQKERENCGGSAPGPKGKTHYECRGTLSYMAPEILDQTICAKKGYNPEQTDLFSLGVILFSMFLGKPPFRQADSRKDDLYRMLCEYKYKQFWDLWETQWAQSAGITITKEFKSIFSSLTSPQPYERLSITDLLYHPWLVTGLKDLGNFEIQRIKEEMKNIHQRILNE